MTTREAVVWGASYAMYVTHMQHFTCSTYVEFDSDKVLCAEAMGHADRVLAKLRESLTSRGGETVSVDPYADEHWQAIRSALAQRTITLEQFLADPGEAARLSEIGNLIVTKDGKPRLLLCTPRPVSDG